MGTVNQATQNLEISNVEIFGADRTKDAIAVNTGSTQANYSVLMLKDNVFVHDLKFTKGTSCSYLRSPINLSGGNSIVSNCWFTALSAKTGYDVYGHFAGYASAGLITHCLFTNIHTDNSGNDGAHGVGLLGLAGTAQMRNSIFAGNYHGSNMRGPADGVITLKGNAVLENCVIYGNYTKASSNGDSQSQSDYHTHPRNGGGVIVRSGSPTIRNCVIRNNKKPNDYMADPPAGYDMYAATVEKDIYIVDGARPLIENCNLPEGQVPEGAVNCQTENPAFVDVSNNDFSIAADSPCVDAGAFQKWQIDATDYTGITPRYQGEMVDIGAYEVVKPTPPTAHIELGGTLEAEKYATATMSAFVTGLKLSSGATFKWYTSDPQEGSPEPFATGNPAEYRFTEGTWTIYLKIENADGAGNDLYGAVTDAVVVTRGADFYVSATGDDEASGDIDAPFQTLEHALEGMSAGQSVKIVGAVNVNTVLTLVGVEVYGDGPGQSTLNLPGTKNDEIKLGDNAFLHSLKLTDQFQTSHGSRFNMVGEGAVVSNCFVTGFNGNTANGPAGGYASAGTITHCFFYSIRPGNGGNDGSRGFAIVELAGTARMINSIMTNCGPDSNVRGPLDGVLAMSGNAILENCVIHGNRSKATASGDAQDEKSYHQRPRRCGGIFVKSGSPVIRDCIIRDNKKAHVPSDGKYPTETGEDIYAATEESDFQILAGATPKISFCNIPEGQVPECATNCQTGDPKFAKPDVTPAETRDFSIAEDSPCVDAGNGKGWRKGATDYAGNPRIQGRRVDIGAYEYNSGVVDWGLQILVR